LCDRVGLTSRSRAKIPNKAKEYATIVEQVKEARLEVEKLIAARDKVEEQTKSIQGTWCDSQTLFDVRFQMSIVLCWRRQGRRLGWALM
jgi:hypothetical protein